MSYELFMQKAIDLAKNGLGKVSPNPLVGAVIVKDGKIISEGWHSRYGEAHAEIEAINNAIGADLSGAEIYINLEPCSHFGKTPPCVDEIIKNKFGKVIIAMEDPNPLVSGSGVKKLHENGIEVVTGIMEKEARHLNRFFIKHITEGMPYVILKVGQTIDGAIATAKGQSKWITSEESRKKVHQMRSEIDCVLIGKNTACSDNPSLTVREVNGRNPKRVILDTNLSILLDLKLLKQADRKNTIVCCSETAFKSRKANNLRVTGVKVLPIPKSKDGHLDLNSVLEELSTKMNFNSIMVEGGSNVFSAFIKENLVDELRVFIAPKIMGKAINTFNGMNINYLSEIIEMQLESVQQCGPDIDCTFARKS